MDTVDCLSNSVKSVIASQKIRIQNPDNFRFIRGFDGEESSIIKNNLYAYQFSNIFYTNIPGLKHPLSKTIKDFFVDKIISNGILLNGNPEQIEKFTEKLSLDEIQEILGLAFDFSISKGASIIKSDFNSLNQEFSYSVFSLGEFKISFNAKKKINNVKIYLHSFKGLANEDSNSMYVLCENRYFLNGIPIGVYTIENWSWAFNDSNKYSTAKQKPTSFEQLNDSVKQWLIDNEIELNKEVRLMFNDSLGIYFISNSRHNSIFTKSKIGDSLFLGLEDLFMTLDTTLTSKEVDKYLGRGRALVPKAMQSGLQQSAVGKVALMQRNILLQNDSSAQTLTNVSNIGTLLDSTFFTEIPGGLDPSKPMQPTSVQFNLRINEWREEILGCVGDICSAVGITASMIDPRLVGSGQKTATQISAEEDQTRATIEGKRRIADREIQRLIDDLCNYLNIESISLQWPDAGMSNAYLRSQVVTSEYTNGVRSIESTVKKINPDWSQEETDKEIQRLKSINLNEAKNIFDNLGNEEVEDENV